MISLAAKSTSLIRNLLFVFACGLTLLDDEALLSVCAYIDLNLGGRHRGTRIEPAYVVPRLCGACEGGRERR